MWLFIAPIVADPQSGLKEKTVKKHTGNIRFYIYINEFFNGCGSSETTPDRGETRA